MFERKDAKVQRRKESPKQEAFKKYPGTVPAFWVLSIARLSKRYRWAIFLAVISILTVALLFSALFMTPDPQKFWSGFFSIIAVAAIVDAAMSVLIPIFHLLSYREMKDLDSGDESRLEAIDAQIAQLEGRLADLRQLRMENTYDDEPLESGVLAR